MTRFILIYAKTVDGRESMASSRAVTPQGSFGLPLDTEDIRRKGIISWLSVWKVILS